jgi:hypothetical protein
MKLSLRDNLYICSTNSIWVCLIEGRYLVSKYGKTSWRRRCDAINTFKRSDYWKYICINKSAQEIEDIYNDFIEKGLIKFIELKPVPKWADI